MSIEEPAIPVLTWDERVEGWLFDQTDTHYVHIMPMIYNHRVVLTPLDDLCGYDVGWCYPDLASAVAACVVWRHRGWDGEPRLYLKRID